MAALQGKTENGETHAAMAASWASFNRSMLIYRLRPHLVPDTWRSLAHTSIGHPGNGPQPASCASFDTGISGMDNLFSPDLISSFLQRV